MIRRRKSLLATIKKRVQIRKTKSDQVIEVRNLPVREVILEMDDFFNQMALTIALYKKMRTEALKRVSTQVLHELLEVKKGFIRTVSLIRYYHDLVPVFDPKKNIKLANTMYKLGYTQEAIDMCKELGVDYFDFFTPMKRTKSIPKRKQEIISKETLRILKKNKPDKGITIADGERKNYFIYVNEKGEHIVHNAYLSKNVWVATYMLKCVAVSKKEETFTPDPPKVGQYVKAKRGEWLQIAWFRKRDKFLSVKDPEEKKRLRKIKENTLKRLRLKKKKQEEKDRKKAYKKAQNEKARLKKLAEIAEQQRKKAEERELKRQEKALSRIKIKIKPEPVPVPVVVKEKVITYLPDSDYIKDIKFNNLCQRKIREELPMFLKKPWNTIQMKDFIGVNYDDLFIAMGKSRPTINNLESVCKKYGINLKQEES